MSAPALNVRMTDRQKIIFALIASVLVHVLIFVALCLWGLFSRSVAKSRPLEKVKLVEVAVATPTPTPATFEIVPERPMATPTPVISSDDLNKTDKTPKKALFESDENLVAGSKQPPTGNLPLPSQEGKIREPLAFSTHSYMLGSGEGGAPAPPVMEFAPAPPPQLTRPASTPMPPMRVTSPPAATPAPTAMPTPQEEPKMTSSTPVPAPTAPKEAIYRPTPVPVATVAPTPDDLLHPTPVPTPKPDNIAVNPPRPNPPAEPAQPRQPAYIPETQQNRIQGNLSNNDKPGVDAIGTPKGRYEKKISAAIGSLWYYYCHERRDLITAGTVHIRFYINGKGQVEEPQIISNTSSEVLAGCSMDAIRKAKLLPPPAELAASLENGRYEADFNFTINPYQ